MVSFVLGVYMVSRLVRGIVSAKHLGEFFMMSSSTPVTPRHHSEIAPMSQMLEFEQEILEEGAEGIDPIIREETSHGLHFKPPVEPLLLLLQATQLEEKALSEDSFTAVAVGTLVQQITGFWPVDIEVVTNKDMILEFHLLSQVKLHRGFMGLGNGMANWQIWNVY